jgi:FkbM family methyltransferase
MESDRVRHVGLVAAGAAIISAVKNLSQRPTPGPDWLRSLAGHPRLLPLTALLLRARMVSESVAFFARQLLRQGGVFAYRLRSAEGMRVLVRHGPTDPVILGEVFHEWYYAPPAAMPAFEPRRIVDLGANVGYFGAFALAEWPDASVVAYEPDPANAAIHAGTIALNGLDDRWTLHRAAAAATDGELRFHAWGHALSHVADDGDTVVPAHDVLPLVAGADLLKIDTEGAEWPILRDPRFAADPPRVVVLEYHPDGAPGPDPRAAVLELLADAGLTATASIFERADGYGMLWAWRP